MALTMKGNLITLRQPLVWRLAFVAILLIASALRWYGLAARSLWFDEALEYWVISVPLNHVLEMVRQILFDPPLYSYLLHFWHKVRIDEFWLRALSLFFSLMGIAGVVRMGKSVLNVRVGLVAGLLMAVSAADVRYAQEAGQYALMVFALAWYLVFLRLAIMKDRWLYWGLWAGAAVVAIYSHYGSAITVAATAVVALVDNLVRRKWTTTVHQLSTGVIALLLLLPLLFLLSFQAVRFGSIPQPVNWLAFLQTSRDIVLFQLMGNQTGGWPWLQLPSWVIWLPLVIAVLVALLKVKSLLDWPILLIVSWLAYYLITRLGSYVFIPTRHSLMLIPLLMTAAATGIVVIWRWNRAISLAFLVTIVAATLLAPREGQENIRAATHFWLSQHQPGEITYIYYGAVPGFRYQLDVIRGYSEDVPPMWYRECFAGREAPHCAENGVFYGRWIRQLSPQEKRESILGTIGSVPERLWLIFSHVHEREHEVILDVLAAEYEVTQQYEGENGLAYLLQKH